MKYLLSIIYIVFTTLGVTLMKLGGDSLRLSLKSRLEFKIGWITLSGFISYLVSFILWQKLLVRYDLSILVPILTGITQILFLIIGYTVFKESINIQSLIGSSLIVIGIIIIAFAGK